MNIFYSTLTFAVILVFSSFAHAQTPCELDSLGPVISADAVVDLSDCSSFSPMVSATDGDGNSVSISMQAQPSTRCILHQPDIGANLCEYSNEAAMMNFSVPVDYKYYTLDSGYFETLPGGAHIYAEFSGIANPNGHLVANVWLANPMTWAQWSTQDSPHGYKADCGVDGSTHADWTFYHILSSSNLTGTGDFAGSYMTIHHAPASAYFGYQVGLNANNYSNGFGSGGWFSAIGTMMDTSTGYSHTGTMNGDFMFIHECGENNLQNTITAIDACGNTSSFIQEVTLCDTPAPVLVNMPVAGETFITCDFAGWEPSWFSYCTHFTETSFSLEAAADDHVIIHTSATDICGQSSEYDIDVIVLVPDEPCPQFNCPGDFDENAIIGASDLPLFIGAFGTNDAQFDLNMDGMVDVLDLLMVIESYGNLCDE